MCSTMPLVSVIVPNYNHAKYLHQRIDSILNQSFQDFELILLDDSSTDSSREILSSYDEDPHVSHLVFNESNSGSPFAQWEKGIALAHGEWIWIAESDDWADDHFLETMLNEARAYPTTGLLYAKAQYMYPDGKSWSPKVTGQSLFYTGSNFIHQYLLFANVIYNVSMTLFRRALVESIDFSKFNHMRLCGDWFFYTLLCEQTNVLEVDRILSYYRVHDINTSYLAECEGLTFLEGLDVLDYLVYKYAFPQRLYGKQWGKQLAVYQNKFSYSTSVRRKIIERLRGKYSIIIIFYILYVIKKHFS